MCKKTSDYHLGLIYCVLNDIDNAYFYLNRAAKKGDETAINTLKELKEKNLLPTFIKENKSEFRFSNRTDIPLVTP